MRHLRQIIIFATTNAIIMLFIMVVFRPFHLDNAPIEFRNLFIVGIIISTFIASAIADCICIFIFNIRHNIGDSRSVIILKQLIYSCFRIPILSISLMIICSLWDSKAFPSHDIIKVFFIFCVNIAIISFFMFIINLYILENRNLKIELDEIRNINALLEKQQEYLASESEIKKPKEYCLLQSNYGENSISFHPTDLLYIESIGNYAEIYYMQDSKMHHTTLRKTLKSIIEALNNINYIVQCHRAFLININYIESLSKSEIGYEIHLFGREKAIPISRSNIKKMKEVITKMNIPKTKRI